MQLLVPDREQSAFLAAGEARAVGGAACPEAWAPAPGRAVWALEKDGALIGGARAEAGVLTGLYILPPWQGKGYGRYLLRAVLRQPGHPAAVAAPGDAAGFFRRLGFAPQPDGLWRRPAPVSDGVVWAQRALAEALADKPAPVCIDATCGNGHDTVFLAGLGGRVLALDIQPAAVQATRARLTAAGYADPARYRVVQGDHARLAALAAREGFAPADGVMFNFGWLPGADHGVQSRAHSSRTALAAALALLAPGGALTAVLYSPGHGPQEEEKQAVLAYLTGLDEARFAVTVHPGHPGAPLPVLVRRLPV